VHRRTIGYFWGGKDPVEGKKETSSNTEKGGKKKEEKKTKKAQQGTKKKGGKQKHKRGKKKLFMPGGRNKTTQGEWMRKNGQDQNKKIQDGKGRTR